MRRGTWIFTAHGAGEGLRRLGARLRGQDAAAQREFGADEDGEGAEVPEVEGERHQIIEFRAKVDSWRPSPRAWVATLHGPMFLPSLPLRKTC
mmetsp:Transcript_93468/g.283834  ORF Transcript_93468/g.283834 Transcript_93468/m.283834 type:complete len:93 (-) Transcript_93468:22-300(-)